jgi:hypothetical protein
MGKPKAPAEKHLDALRTTLLRNRPTTVLSPEDGALAFLSHKLLSGEVLRAAKLDQMKRESETDAFVRYVTTYFPKGRGRGDADTARDLFKDWRTSLAKLDAPGPIVPITHGQPSAHWQRDEHGRLCLNLEDAWDDYAYSVDQFVNYVRTSARHKIILKRVRAHEWQVSQFVPTIISPADRAAILASATVMDASVSASFAASATAIGITNSAHSVTASPPPPKRK